MPVFTDIGANLHHSSFDHDREQVLGRAHDAQVKTIIVTGSCMESSLGAAQMSGNTAGVELYSTAGLHPHQAKDWTNEMAACFRNLAQHERVVALGECGLDYNREFSPRDAQIIAFRAQLDLAIETQMPLFLHQRDAHADFVAELKPRLPELKDVVVHCFTGSAEELADYVALDVYVGITGWICDERRGSHLLDCVNLIPDNRLLIETDAPYLIPRNTQPRLKTRRNEPMLLPLVCKTVAEARGQEPEYVADITNRNARQFFCLDSLLT